MRQKTHRWSLAYVLGSCVAAPLRCLTYSRYMAGKFCKNSGTMIRTKSRIETQKNPQVESLRIGLFATGEVTLTEPSQLRHSG